MSLAKNLFFLAFFVSTINVIGQSSKTFEQIFKGSKNYKGGRYNYEAKIKYRLYNAGLGDLSMQIGVVSYDITNFYYKGKDRRYDYNFPIKDASEQFDIKGFVNIYLRSDRIRTYGFEEGSVRKGALDLYYFSNEDKQSIIGLLGLKENKNNLENTTLKIRDGLSIKPIGLYALDDIVAEIDNDITNSKRVNTTASNTGLTINKRNSSSSSSGNRSSSTSNTTKSQSRSSYTPQKSFAQLERERLARERYKSEQAIKQAGRELGNLVSDLFFSKSDARTEQKIKDHSSNIKTKLDEMRAAYSTFESAIEEKDNIKVLKIHDDLSTIESSITKSARAINFYDGNVEGLDKIKTTISKSNEKRSAIINKVKESLLNNFYKLSPEKKREFIEILPYSESKNIAREFVEDDHMMVYRSNWELARKGLIKNNSRYGVWEFYNGDNVIRKHLYDNEGKLTKSISFRNNGKILTVFSLNKNNKYDNQSYHPNGNIQSVGQSIIQGEYFFQSGVKSHYNDSGELYHLTKTKENGNLVNRIRYHRNGKKASEDLFKENHHYGVFNTYYTNGQLRQSIEYRYPEKKGYDSTTVPINSIIAFNKDGQLLDDGNLSNGNGTIIIYDINGDMLKMITVKNHRTKSTISNNQEKIQKAYQKFRKKNPYNPKTDFDISNHTTYDIEPLPISKTLLDEVLSAFKNAEK